MPNRDVQSKLYDGLLVECKNKISCDMFDPELAKSFLLSEKVRFRIGVKAGRVDQGWVYGMIGEGSLSGSIDGGSNFAGVGVGEGCRTIK